jgi:cellulose biosynthesis protein BcsQ
MARKLKMQRIISLFSEKGGVGKTTTALALASGFVVAHGLRVIVINRDPQPSAHIVSKKGLLPFPVLDAEHCPEDLSLFDVVIYDHPSTLDPRYYPSPDVNVVVIPFKANAIDFDSARRTAEKLRETHSHAKIIYLASEVRGEIQKAMVETLRVPMISDHTVIGQLSDAGLTVFTGREGYLSQLASLGTEQAARAETARELIPSDRSSIRKIRLEYDAIIHKILKG